jgi:hypothetical protein
VHRVPVGPRTLIRQILKQLSLTTGLAYSMQVSSSSKEETTHLHRSACYAAFIGISAGVFQCLTPMQPTLVQAHHTAGSIRPTYDLLAILDYTTLRNQTPAETELR